MSLAAGNLSPRQSQRRLCTQKVIVGSVELVLVDSNVGCCSHVVLQAQEVAGSLLDLANCHSNMPASCAVKTYDVCNYLSCWSVLKPCVSDAKDMHISGSCGFIPRLTDGCSSLPCPITCYVGMPC